MIFVNFKTYKEGSGAQAVQLVKTISEVSQETGITIIPVVQTLDLHLIKNNFSGEVWVQSVDTFEFGPHTGAVNAKHVFDMGASGVFVNHSENPLENTQKIIEHTKAIAGIGLKSLLFVGGLDLFDVFSTAKVDYLAYEPPELVGGESGSVSSQEPDAISQAVQKAKSISTPLIVGAGIKSKEDVMIAKKLGAEGIAISSSVVLSDDPKLVLRELSLGFNVLTI